MKTKFHQMLTIFGFFVLSTGSVIAVSWGINDLVYTPNLQDKSIPLVKAIEIKKDKKFNSTLKLIIPKLRVK